MGMTKDTVLPWRTFKKKDHWNRTSGSKVMVLYAHPTFPNTSGNFRKFVDTSENFWKLPEISGHFRKIPETSENFRKFPDISGNVRVFPEISGYFRKFLEISGHFRKFPATSGKVTSSFLMTSSRPFDVLFVEKKKNFKKFQKKIQKFFGLKKIFMTLRPFLRILGSPWCRVPMV